MWKTLGWKYLAGRSNGFSLDDSFYIDDLLCKYVVADVADLIPRIFIASPVKSILLYVIAGYFPIQFIVCPVNTVRYLCAMFSDMNHSAYK